LKKVKEHMENQNKAMKVEITRLQGVIRSKAKNQKKGMEPAAGSGRGGGSNCQCTLPHILCKFHTPSLGSSGHVQYHRGILLRWCYMCLGAVRLRARRVALAPPGPLPPVPFLVRLRGPRSLPLALFPPHGTGIVS
jgi:hypothetical protein